MALRTLVKVSGINNLAEARYCAGMGVSYIGYSCDPDNSDRLPANEILEIQSWLSGVTPVLELGKRGEVPSELPSKESCVEIEFDRISVFSKENTFVRMMDWDFSSEVFSKSIAVITPPVTEADVDSYLPILKKYAEQPIFISWNGSPEGLKNFLSRYSPYGLEMSGKGRQASGIFEAHDLADMIEILEVED